MSRTIERSFALVLTGIAFALGGCVANQEKEPDVCPPNQTLVCETRMGKADEEDCSCKNKAQMRDVFDLRRNR